MKKSSDSLTERFIDRVEKSVRFIPSPLKLFLWLIVLISAAAALVSLLTGAMTDPSTGETFAVRNPISGAGLRWLLTSFVDNFTSYAAFGPVLVMMVAVGICEESGFISALMTKSTSRLSARLVPLAICLIGVLSNAAGNSSIIVMTPIAGFSYLAIGKNPVLGMITCYIANASGMSANFILCSVDVMTTQITNAALEASGSGIRLDIACNWYFFFVSTIVITLTVYLISEKLLARSFKPLTDEHVASILAASSKSIAVDARQTRALKLSGAAFAVFLALIIAAAAFGALRDEEGTVSPLLDGLVMLFFLAFILLAVVYGRAAGTITRFADVEKMACRSVEKVASYIVLAIVIGQFVALLGWTQLTKALAVAAVGWLQNAGASGLGLLLLFMLLVVVVDVFMSATGSKWSVFAPFAVPIFMQMGWHPALIQTAFRVADSATNIASPISPFLYMLIDISKDTFKIEDCSVAKWLACLIPAALIILVVWTAMLLIWIALDIPVGPGAGIHLA